MKIIHQNIKKGEAKVQVENLDDLWYLSTIIEPGDLVKGKTFRKIKIGENTDRNVKIIKKPVTLKLNVEKTEFSDSTLRISGTITEGPEDISKGSYHSFNIEENTIITIIKEKWLKFQLDKLKESSEQKTSKILICVFDRETATFALMKKYGFQILSELSGTVQKKADPTKIKDTFYNEIIKILKEYSERHKIQHILLASPAFFKEDLMKELKDDTLKKMIVLATCNDTGKSGITEVLKRPEAKEVLKQDRIAKETKIVEKLLAEISKDKLATYGLKHVENATNAGAVTELLLTDSYIQKTRENNKYEKIDSIMKTVDSMKGEIHIISSEHEAGKKLDGLGGIAALLRYKI